MNKITATMTILLLQTQLAFAAGSVLPWESPLEIIVNSFTGPVAFAASALALVVLAVKYAYEGEMSAITRTFFTIVIVISILVGVLGLLASLFGVTKGAEFIILGANA